MKKWKHLLKAVMAVGVIAMTAVQICAAAEGTAQAAASEVTPVSISTNEIAGWPAGPEITSETGVLMDADSGTLLYSKGGDEIRYPASITKIMTLLLAVENCSLKEDVVFTETGTRDISWDSGNIGMQVGEVMSMRACLYALVIRSANEVAAQIAEHVGGTEQHFVDMMNERAAQIGCTNTHFVNASGLPDPDHYSTAHDMALIAQAAYQNETFRIIIGTKMYTIPPTNKHAEETVLRNHHDMLCTYHNANRKYLYPYCVGGKTGYTATANSTLVTYAEKDGMTLICVVMNTQSPNQFIDTVNLFDYAFDNFQVLNVAENDTNYSAETTVDNGNLNNIEPFVELDKDAVIVLPKTAEFSDTSSSVEYNDSDPEIAGSITYTYAGRNVGKADIKTTGVVVEGYAFDNESTEEEEQEVVSTVQVRPIVVVLLIVAVILLGVLLFFLKRFYDNYYIIKHNRAVRRDRKDQKRRIRKKRRRRRRWR